MKILGIITILFLINFCQPQIKKEIVSNEDIKEALQVALDSAILGKFKLDYEISSIFNRSLKDSDIYNDLINIDVTLNEKNVF